MQGLPQFFVFITLLHYGLCDRTKDKMYEKIDAYNACFRRLNATHQVGCSSTRKGSTGVIHFCETQENLEYILNKGSAGPYIPVISTKMLTKENIELLIKSDKVSGLLLYKSNETLEHFTHDNTCPNERFSLANTCEKNWNEYGTGLLYRDVPFPMFFIESEKNINIVRNYFKKFNDFDYDRQRDRSLCSIQMKAFMYGSTDTPTCLRRSNLKFNINPVRFCDPLGDQNIFSVLYPLVKGPNKTEPVRNSKYVVIAARLDTTSILDNTAGAESPITGIVALLATAKLLKTMLPPVDDNNLPGTNVLFLLINGETYDYIGSQRLLYDMQNNRFPTSNNSTLPLITPEDISLFVEFSQVSKSDSLVVYHYSNTEKKVLNFIDLLTTNKKGLNLVQTPGIVPPSSMQTFLKNNTEFPSLLITNHRFTYVNKFYNSFYDNASNINFTYFKDENSIPLDSVQNYIGDVVDMVSKSVYETVTGNNYTGSAGANRFLINELLHCYLENSTCKVHQSIQASNLNNYNLNLYVSVDTVQNTFTTLVGLALAWLTGDDIGPQSSACKNEPRNYAFRYFNMSKSMDDLNNTRCFRTTMNFTEAVSPAFIIPDYDWNSGLYSTWSESGWGDISMQIFLKPSAAHETMTISVGSVTLAFSLMLVYFIKSRSHILFAPSIPTEAPTDC